MIGRIRGILIEKQAPEVLIEAAGVAYEVQLSMTSYYQLPDAGQEIILYTHFVVREDAQLLFGFVDKEERALFRELIKANGVGPKLALTILSGMSATQFMQCINHDDLTSLVKLPGVGRKTAERLVVEMRDRLKKMMLSLDAGATTKGGTAPQSHSFVISSGPKDEALSALMALGYKAPQATKVVNAVYVEGISSENLIREALRSMG